MFSNLRNFCSNMLHCFRSEDRGDLQAFSSGSDHQGSPETLQPGWAGSPPPTCRGPAQAEPAGSRRESTRMGLSGTFTFKHSDVSLFESQVPFYNFSDPCCFLGFFPEIFFTLYVICNLQITLLQVTFWFCKISFFPDVPFWDTFVKLGGWYFILINRLLCLNILDTSLELSGSFTEH